MIVMLIVIGILAAAAIGMLLVTPIVLKSIAANLAGQSNNDTNMTLMAAATSSSQEVETFL